MRVILRLADRMFMLAIVLYALQRYGSPTFMGWVAFAALFPGLIASPFSGVLLDRLRAPLAIAVDLLVMACVLLGPYSAQRASTCQRSRS